jgi:hypothetical protein
MDSKEFKNLIGFDETYLFAQSQVQPRINVYNGSMNSVYNSVHDWNIEIIHFENTDREIYDHYDVTPFVTELLMLFNDIHIYEEMGEEMISEMYRSYLRPELVRIGINLSVLAGKWIMYGVVSVLMNYDRDYAVLADECWKNCGVGYKGYIEINTIQGDSNNPH